MSSAAGAAYSNRPDLSQSAADPEAGPATGKERLQMLIIYGECPASRSKGGYPVGPWEKAEIDVVASAEDLKQLTIKASAALIAQTTGHSMVYAEIKAAFLQLCPGGKVYDTLCPETGIRQREAVQLAKEVGGHGGGRKRYTALTPGLWLKPASV